MSNILRSRPYEVPASHERSVPEPFLETLENMQVNLLRQGIEYRVIGSIASAGLLQEAGNGAAAQLDFDRRGAHTRDQRVPDIDLLIARGDIRGLRPLRKKYASGAYPVKVGIATGLHDIDFQPHAANSYLVHRNLRFPFENERLRPKVAAYEGASIRTIEPDALFHMYVTIGSLLRWRDVPVVRALHALAPQDSVEHQQKYSVFHAFIRERNTRYPMARRVSLMQEILHDRIPPRAYHFGMTQMLRGASLLRQR